MKLRCCGSKLGSVWCKQHLTLSMSGVGLFFNKFIYKSPFFSREQSTVELVTEKGTGVEWWRMEMQRRDQANAITGSGGWEGVVCEVVLSGQSIDWSGKNAKWWVRSQSRAFRGIDLLVA